MNEERYHETLGLRRGATREEIKTAYRDMAKVWHPDRFAHDPQLQSKAQDKLKEINEAYKRLTSPLPSRQRAPRRDDAESAAARHAAWRDARARYHSTPGYVVVRESGARRSALPALAAVIVVAAVTFFAAARLVADKRDANITATPASPSVVAPPGADAPELSSADAQRERKASARQKSLDASAPDAFAPAPVRVLPTVTRTIDPTTGLLAARSCPTRALMTYPAGSEPQSFCAADHAPKTHAPRAPETTGGAPPAPPAEAKEKSRLKSVVGTLASPGKWFKKKKEKPAAQP